MAMKIATGTKPSSPRIGIPKTVVHKKGSGHKKQQPFEVQRAAVVLPLPITAHSTSTATGSTSNTVRPSSHLAKVAMNSKSSLTKRITLPSFKSSSTTPCGTGTNGSGMDLPAPTPTPTTVIDEITNSSNDSSFPSTSPPFRSVWYLGGNQLAQLLTSVDGDLDPVLLATIAEVPSVVGDLALSVEFLVSDDVSTVGGFETELLARIASNTLAAKQQQQQHIQNQQQHPPTTTTTMKGVLPSFSEPSSPHLAPASDKAVSSSAKKGSSTGIQCPLLPTLDDDSLSHATMEPTVDMSDAADTTGVVPEAALVSLVPNPLAHYDPVPNPLARITPPASPLTTTTTIATTSPFAKR
jgi:hypothetical protein